MPHRVAFDSAVIRFESARADMRQRTWIQNAEMAVVRISVAATELACHLCRTVLSHSPKGL
ncbi:MAG: hypothetical protein DWH97_04300 [Planctomycetota bacterium]|nr:MAG: hypothetical protein DWH97_04300 [Planctomycetota bacterium]RLS93377.1 MAG: hypothetical protein DWI12_09225 [Planctomycetota bacterium]